MIVKELIEKLSKVDPELFVRIDNSTGEYGSGELQIIVIEEKFCAEKELFIVSCNPDILESIYGCGEII